MLVRARHDHALAVEDRGERPRRHLLLALVMLFIWVRATLPRLRYDQLMALGWKVMLPLATLNILVTAVIVTVS